MLQPPATIPADIIRRSVTLKVLEIVPSSSIAKHALVNIDHGNIARVVARQNALKSLDASKASARAQIDETRFAEYRISETRQQKEIEMIIHTVKVKLKTDVEKSMLEPVIYELKQLGSENDGILETCVGHEIGGESDYGAVFIFRNTNAYREYLDSPRHQKVIEVGLPLIESMTSSDIVDDPDPLIAGEIARLRQSARSPA